MRKSSLLLLALVACGSPTEPEVERQPCVFGVNESTDQVAFLRDTVPDEVLATCSEVIIMVTFPDGWTLERPVVSG